MNRAAVVRRDVVTPIAQTLRAAPTAPTSSMPPTSHRIDLDPEAAWSAIEARDRGADGRFVFGVASTGVYCRPSCPARRPARHRVSFFADPDAAEAAGFRACRRCRPRELAADLALFERVRALLDEAAESGPEGGGTTLAHLARAAGASPSHLQRTFKRATGVSPREYLAARRAERLKAGLRGGESVTDALYDAGYGGSSRLYDQADGRLGMSPGRYRRGGEGIELRYALADTALGRLLVAATERGLAAVAIGERDEALIVELERQLPRAERVRDDAALAEWTAALRAAIDGAPAELAELPIDERCLRASAFAFRVWRELRKIPAGETRTYGEVAAAVGQPKAARAVGRACADNRIALAIPCHRVIRGDGAAGGYRWGGERKKRLLAAESAAG